MGNFQVRGPFSESEVVDIFSKEGIQYETRNERYELLNGTMFETANGGYWISYSKEKPIAVQGIGTYKGAYLLLGLVSHAKDYQGKLGREDTQGAGAVVSEKVISLHGDKPIVGMAKPIGKRKIFAPLGFNEMEIQNGKVVGQEDVPSDVIELIETIYAKGIIPNEVQPIRKLFFKPTVNWFYLMKRK